MGELGELRIQFNIFTWCWKHLPQNLCANFCRFLIYTIVLSIENTKKREHVGSKPIVIVLFENNIGISYSFHQKAVLFSKYNVPSSSNTFDRLQGHSCNIGNAPNLVGKKSKNWDLSVVSLYLTWVYIHYIGKSNGQA